MKIANNNINGVFVQRQIVETVEQPTQYEMPEGLPFYYYFNFNFAITLIVLGVIAMIISAVGSGFFYYLVIFKKKYKCPKCGHTFNDIRGKKPTCPICGTECV